MKRVNVNSLSVTTFLLKSAELVNGKPPAVDTSIYDDGCVAVVVDSNSQFVLYGGEWVAQIV